MREDGRYKFIEEALKKLETSHKEDLRFFGEYNEKRLTGIHETSSLEAFFWGIGNRGASARVTKQIKND